MFSVLVLNPINVDPAADSFGHGLTTPALSELDAGSITLVRSDGAILERTNNAAVADETPWSTRRPDQAFQFVARTANGLQKGIAINPGYCIYAHTEYATPVAQVIDVTIVSPADLTPYVGQYVGIVVTNVGEPEYKIKRTKYYSVMITDENSGDIDTVMAELVDDINHDPDGFVTAVYTDGTDNLELTANEAGVRFNVNPEDVIRESTLTMTTEPVSGPPTSEVAQEEINRSSQEGYNISKMAAELYNLRRTTDPDLTYDVFVIQTVNNIGPSKDPRFTLTQVIAVPTVCTNLITDLTALLDVLTNTDATATWANII